MVDRGYFRNERGSLGLLCALLILAIMIGGLGTWGLMRRWRHLMELQLRLDRCVGEKTREMRTLLNLADASNRRMRAARLAAGAEAILARDGGAVARMEIRAEFLLQEGLQWKWRLEEAQWLLHKGCGDQEDIPIPLPDMSWEREPEDLWGPGNFEWSQQEFKIRVVHRPRAAAAVVTRGPDRATTSSRIGGFSGAGFNSWKVYWDRPFF